MKKHLFLAVLLLGLVGCSSGPSRTTFEAPKTLIHPVPLNLPVTLATGKTVTQADVRGTIEPIGQPSDISSNWYKQIADALTQKGFAKVDFVFANGNAYRATYWIDRNESKQFVLRYVADFKKSGEWQQNRESFRYEHPEMKGLSTTHSWKGRGLQQNEKLIN